jgi:hypothetical protein
LVVPSEPLDKLLGKENTEDMLLVIPIAFPPDPAVAAVRVIVAVGADAVTPVAPFIVIAAARFEAASAGTLSMAKTDPEFETLAPFDRLVRVMPLAEVSPS